MHVKTALFCSLFSAFFHVFVGKCNTATSSHHTHSDILSGILWLPLWKGQAHESNNQARCVKLIHPFISPIVDMMWRQGNVLPHTPPTYLLSSSHLFSLLTLLLFLFLLSCRSSLSVRLPFSALHPTPNAPCKLCLKVTYRCLCALSHYFLKSLNEHRRSQKMTSNWCRVWLSGYLCAADSWDCI